MSYRELSEDEIKDNLRKIQEYEKDISNLYKKIEDIGNKKNAIVKKTYFYVIDIEFYDKFIYFTNKEQAIYVCNKLISKGISNVKIRKLFTYDYDLINFHKDIDLLISDILNRKKVSNNNFN